MTSDRKANANRKNATKSTGPKTVNGKNIVRRNALRHGLAAQVLVVEGEDREDFRAMAGGHLAAFRPRNDVELELVNTFTISAWTRLRCVSTHTGMINQHIRETQIAEEIRLKDRVFELGRRLFFDSQERWPLFPDPSTDDFPVFKRKSDPFSGHEPPARLVNELETTYLGCCWLLERWNELRVLTLPGNTWRAFDKFKAIRLLGKQPLDVLDDPSGDLAVIFLATHAICPMSKYAFNALRCELENLQFAVVRKRLEDRGIERFAPANEDAARQLLNNLISREIGRLEQLALERRNEADAEAAERLSRLAFDPSDEADKVRRYEDAAIRRMSRSCMDFIKVRQNGILSEDADDEPGLVSGPDVADGKPGSEQALEPTTTGGRSDLGSGEEPFTRQCSNAPTLLPEMTDDSPRPAVNGGPPAAGETATNETEAPGPAAVPSAGAQASETKVNGPRFTVHAVGGPMIGLLLLIWLTWLMASGQGAALSSEGGIFLTRDDGQRDRSGAAKYQLPLPVGEGWGEGPIAATMPWVKTVGTGRFDWRKLFVPLAPHPSPLPKEGERVTSHRALRCGGAAGRLPARCHKTPPSEAALRASAMSSGFAAFAEFVESPPVPSTGAEPNHIPKCLRGTLQNIAIRWAGPSLALRADIATTACDRSPRDGK